MSDRATGSEAMNRTRPDLERSEPAGTTRGLVLMLHGGTQQSLDPVGPRNGSLTRIRVMRSRLAPRVLNGGCAVWLLRYGTR
ncbi:MAG: hypothetical protein M3Y66_00540, partial [Actinomycetota bacterium]|nr:hypothetical protein [Actinomycetota bacterium]